MAKCGNDGVRVSGRFRDRVFRETKFGTIMVEYNEGTYEHMKWSDKQKQSRSKFKALTKLAQVFKAANDLGFKLEMKYTSQPLFIKHNYSTMVADENGDLKPDYARICMSNGTLAILDDIGFRRDENDVTLSWKWTSGVEGQWSDKVAVMLYCPDYKPDDPKRIMGETQLIVDKHTRDKGKLTFTIPEKWAGLPVYGYVFTFNEAGKSSNSQFFGILR